MPDQESAAQDVIGCLYEAVSTPEHWPDALDRVTSLFGSMAAHFFLWDDAADRPVASFGSNTYLGRQEALNYYLRIDPRRRLIATRPAGSVMLCHEHLDDAFVRKNEFFQDYSLPLGRRYLMAAKLRQSGSIASILAVLRSPSQGPFGPREQALLTHLRPHLERVARLHRQLEKRQVQRDLLDGVASALIATDSAARPVEVNKAAEVLLTGTRGLRVVAGRIVAWDSGQTDALHRLIDHAARPKPSAGGLIVDGPDGERLGVMVGPLGGPRDGHARDAGRALAMLAVNSLNPRPQSFH
jgi:PAS domain-containing protein